MWGRFLTRQKFIGFGWQVENVPPAQNDNARMCHNDQLAQRFILSGRFQYCDAPRTAPHQRTDLSHTRLESNSTMPTIYELANWIILAQAGGGGGGAGGGGAGCDGGAVDAAKEGGEKAQDGVGPDCTSMMIPFLLIGVLFYFMMIRPQRRQQRGLKDLLANLKKNDKVVTIGGIVGTVVIVEKDRPYVTLRVDEKSETKIRMLRSSISRILTDEDELDKKDQGKGS